MPLVSLELEHFQILSY